MQPENQETNIQPEPTQSSSMPTTLPENNTNDSNQVISSNSKGTNNTGLSVTSPKESFLKNPVFAMSSRYKKVVVIIFMLIIVGLIYMITKKTTIKSAVNKTDSNSIKISSAQDRPDGTLDLSKLISEKMGSTQKSEKLSAAKMNQQVDTVDGISYMVTKVVRNYKPKKPYDYQNKEYIKVYGLVGNRKMNVPLSVTFYDFDIKLSTDVIVRSLAYSKTDEPDVIDATVTLKTGEQTKVAMIYAIPSGSTPINVVRDAKIVDNVNNSEVTRASYYSEVTIE